MIFLSTLASAVSFASSLPRPTSATTVHCSSVPSAQQSSHPDAATVRKIRSRCRATSRRRPVRAAGAPRRHGPVGGARRSHATGVDTIREANPVRQDGEKPQLPLRIKREYDGDPRDAEADRELRSSGLPPGRAFAALTIINDIEPQEGPNGGPRASGRHPPRRGDDREKYERSDRSRGPTPARYASRDEVRSFDRKPPWVGPSSARASGDRRRDRSRWRRCPLAARWCFGAIQEARARRGAMKIRTWWCSA